MPFEIERVDLKSKMTEAASARRIVAQRLALLAEHRPGPYLCGAYPSVADCYLFGMLLWAMRFDIAIPEDRSDAWGSASGLESTRGFEGSREGG
jgi:glutathione S-transferase